MRCWDCDSLIVVPEIIDGKVGIAGQIRAGIRNTSPRKPQVVTTEMTCGRCGARYLQTTARKPGRAERPENQRRRKDD